MGSTNFFGALLLISLYLINTECCNESVCGSIVSKCLLMQLCRCSPGNYTCNKECFFCLKDSYSECCSCVELCETPDQYQTDDVSSYVGVLDNSVPGLFKALSEEETDWTSESFQISYHINHKDKMKMNNVNQILEKEELTVSECTAVFLNNCTSVSKCEKICASMGASGYRWFHDGCCECVGEECFDFGLKESRCKYCSHSNNLDWEETDEAYHFPEDNDLNEDNGIEDIIW